MVDKLQRHAEQPVVRIALGQQVQMLKNDLGKIEALPVSDEGGSTALEQFDREGAEMIFEAGAPGELDSVSRAEAWRRVSRIDRHG